MLLNHLLANSWQIKINRTCKKQLTILACAILYLRLLLLLAKRHLFVRCVSPVSVYLFVISASDHTCKQIIFCKIYLKWITMILKWSMTETQINFSPFSRTYAKNHWISVIPLKSTMYLIIQIHIPIPLKLHVTPTMIHNPNKYPQGKIV